MKEAFLFALIILGSSQPATAAESMPHVVGLGSAEIVDRGFMWND